MNPQANTKSVSEQYLVNSSQELSPYTVVSAVDEIRKKFNSFVPACVDKVGALEQDVNQLKRAAVPTSLAGDKHQASGDLGRVVALERDVQDLKLRSIPKIRSHPQAMTPSTHDDLLGKLCYLKKENEEFKRRQNDMETKLSGALATLEKLGDLEKRQEKALEHSQNQLREFSRNAERHQCQIAKRDAEIEQLRSDLARCQQHILSCKTDLSNAQMHIGHQDTRITYLENRLGKPRP